MIQTSPTPQTLRLYYYTGKQWGLKALWEKRLKVARYPDVNDPFQLLPFDRRDKRLRAQLQARVDQLLSGPHGILCFSEDWRSILMWAQYGEKHTGLCLGFDVVRELAEPVVYIDTPLREPALDRTQVLRGMSDAVFEAALRCKYSGWRHEREWRLRVRLTEATDDLHYKEFDDSLHLREVIIGPRCNLLPADVVEAVSSPPLDVDIFKATASLDSFEIRRHEEVAAHTAQGFRAALARARDVFADELPEEDGV